MVRRQTWIYGQSPDVTMEDRGQPVQRNLHKALSPKSADGRCGEEHNGTLWGEKWCRWALPFSCALTPSSNSGPESSSLNKLEETQKADLLYKLTTKNKKHSFSYLGWREGHT
jgi:hypothetical protein